MLVYAWCTKETGFARIGTMYTLFNI